MPFDGVGLRRAFCTALRLETTIHDRNGKAARTGRSSRPHPGPGRQSSIWFKLTPLLKAGLDNPMRILMHMAERYGPVIPINLANERIVLLTDPSTSSTCSSPRPIPTSSTSTA